MRVSQIKKSLGHFVKANVPPLFWGRHGVGKTESVQQWCKENGYELVILNLATMEIGDFLGILRDDSKSQKAEYWLPSWFPTNPNAKTLIFLDEVNRAPRHMHQGIFSLLSEKRIHQSYLPAQCAVVAAANYGDDYMVTDIEDAAFMSRFCHVPVHFDAEEWAEWANANGISGTTISFVKENGRYFSKQNEFNYDKVNPGPRNAVWVDRMVKGENHDRWFIETVVFGLLGTAAGTHYLKHCEEYQQYFKGIDVINKFNKIKADVQRVVTEGKRLDMLVTTSDEVYSEAEKLTAEGKKKLTDKQANNLIDYMVTIPRDNGYALLRKFMDNEFTQTAFGESQVLYDHFIEYSKQRKAAEAEKEKAEQKTA